MGYNIAQAGGAAESISRSEGEDASLAETLESLAKACRRGPALVRDKVAGDVEAILNCEHEVERNKVECIAILSQSGGIGRPVS